jgi:hypothetical protein
VFQRRLQRPGAIRFATDLAVMRLAPTQQPVWLRAPKQQCSLQ